MFCVGSTALAFFKINLNRKSKDVDLICSDEQYKNYIKGFMSSGYRVIGLENKPNTKVAFLQDTFNGATKIVEASLWRLDEYYKVGSDSWLYDNLSDDYWEMFNGVRYVTPPVVLMMKLSHRYKKDSVHFHKTRQDILMLRQQGVELDDYLKEILVEREKLTNPSGYKLNVNKKEFFTDNVPYKYDHDSLHIAVAWPNPPAYTWYMQDNAEVMCSKGKFFALPESTRLEGVFEEACVLALERAIIPHGTDPTKAFEIALEKVCTSITKGWFREYAWENYDKVRAMFNPDRLTGLYAEGQSRGTIKPYNQQTQE